MGETERRFTFHRRRWPTGPIMFGLAMALGLAAFLVPDRSASAEPVLVQSTPANDAQLIGPPTRLTFRFNVPIRRFAVAVTRDGETLRTAEPIRGAGPDEAFVELLPGQDGSYRVTWEAYGQDSSLTQGTLGFTVGPPPTQFTTDTAPSTTESTEASTTAAASSATTTSAPPASTIQTSAAPTSVEPLATEAPTSTRRPSTTKPRPASTTTTNTPTTTPASTSIPTASVMTTSPKPTGTSEPSAVPDATPATVNRPLPGSAEVPNVPSGPDVYPRSGRDRSVASTSTTAASPVGTSSVGERASTTQLGPERSTRPPKPLDQPTATALVIPIRGVPTTAPTTVQTQPADSSLDTLGAGTSGIASTSSTSSTVPANQATTPYTAVPSSDAAHGRNLGMGRLRTLLAGLGLASVLTAFGAWFGRPSGAGLRRTLLLFTSLVTALVLALVGFGVLAERNALPHDRGLLSIKMFGGALLLFGVLLRALIARRFGRRQTAPPRGPRILLNEVGFASMSLVVTALLMAR